jgi:hypothetical protein
VVVEKNVGITERSCTTTISAKCLLAVPNKRYRRNRAAGRFISIAKAPPVSHQAGQKPKAAPYYHLIFIWSNNALFINDQSLFYTAFHNYAQK